MKFLMSSLLVVLFGSMAFAGPILNWTSKEVAESDAVEAVQVGVKNYVEEANSCELVNVWALEAINHLKDYYGNPLIVVTSTVEAQGARCELSKYLDCNTVFVKDGVWKYDDTTCDKEESVE